MPNEPSSWFIHFWESDIRSVGALVAVLGFLGGIAEWARRRLRRPALVADAEYLKAYVSPRILDVLGELSHPRVDRGAVAQEWAKMNRETEYRDAVREAESIRSDWQRWPVRMWNVRVINQSDATLHGVTIQIEDAAIVRIKEEHQPPYEVRDTATIELGDFPPREAVEVFAWLRPLTFGRDSIKLRYRDGLGNIRLSGTGFRYFWGSLKRWQHYVAGVMGAIGAISTLYLLLHVVRYIIE